VEKCYDADPNSRCLSQRPGRNNEVQCEATIKGAEQIAMALDPYDPAHAEHIASAAQYFISASAMGIIAGGGSGGGGSRGGGSRGGGARGGVPGGSSGPQSAGATGSETPMTPDFTSIGGQQPGGTLHVMIVGPTEAAQWMAGQLNNFTTRHGGQLIASRSILPTKSGR
jgi:hypothetical protein